MPSSILSASMIQAARLWLTPPFTLALIALPVTAQAAPPNMGNLSITSMTNHSASGTYITANGGTGRFTLVRDELRGYNDSFNIQDGANGIELKNEAAIATGDDRDKFRYTFTITPNTASALHTIKIGQASYTTSGNSEIARHTLSYTSNKNIAAPARATIQSNQSADYYYNAMGDYFMGERLNSTQLRAANAVAAPQLRTDSSNGGESNLYYYNVSNLTGTGNSNPYTPTKNNKAQVSLTNNNGVLPANPTFDRIFKNLVDNSSYAALATNHTLANGGSYVSYGIANSDSDYVIAVQNAASVTLTYEGIMNGNIGIPRAVVGETYNEWISFGVESEPYYRFLGTVFNDNGGINDANANPQQTGGIYNNPDYFNGVLNTSERGITGSTLTLTDCGSGSQTVYATTTTDAQGNYQLDIPAASVRSPVCLTETTRPANYPIATSAATRSIKVTASTRTYPNQDFGHVIQNHAALVLEKFQFANQCTLTSLYADHSGAPHPYTKDAISADNPNVAPMYCIAYKLTATNRANLPINAIVIKDTLAKKGINNARVTATLFDNAKRTSQPAPPIGFIDTLRDGDNGTIETASFELPAKSSRSFYVNTRYGSTQSP